VDALGRVWVAYGDEGIFGNFGWGNPGPIPVGAAGLVCFDATGEKLWEYPASANGMTADCYALNVFGSEAAIFFYTDFPVCRISSDFKLAHWKTELAGCHAFAISRSAALFSGEYNDPTDTAYLGEFDADSQMRARRVRLLLPDGSGLPKGRLLGRGPHLYFFDDLDVYRASLD
jgi:outer membrane protein assembly factor BamB